MLYIAHSHVTALCYEGNTIRVESVDQGNSWLCSCGDLGTCCWCMNMRGHTEHVQHKGGSNILACPVACSMVNHALPVLLHFAAALCFPDHHVRCSVPLTHALPCAPHSCPALCSCSTVVKRPLAQNDRSLTNMVPASVSSLATTSSSVSVCLSSSCLKSFNGK